MQENNFATLSKDKWITYLQDVREDVDDKNASYDFYKMLSSNTDNFQKLLQHQTYPHDYIDKQADAQVDKKRCVELLNLYLHFKKQLNLLQSNTNSMKHLLHLNSTLQKRLSKVEQELARRDKYAADFETNVLSPKLSTSGFCNHFIVNITKKLNSSY